MKSSADFQQAGYATPNPNAAGRRLCDSAQELEKRAFPGAVAADDGRGLALSNFKRDVLQGPEFFQRGLSLPTAVPPPAKRIAKCRLKAMPERVARVRLMANEVAFRNALDCDNCLLAR